MALKFRKQYKRHSVEALRARHQRSMMRRIRNLKVPAPRAFKMGEGAAYLDRLRAVAKEQQQ